MDEEERLTRDTGRWIESKRAVKKARDEFKLMAPAEREAFLKGMRFIATVAMEENDYRRMKGNTQARHETHHINSNYSSLSYIHKRLSERTK